MPENNPMRMPSTRAASFLCAAITGGVLSMSANAEAPSLEGTSWVLSSLEGHDLDPSQSATLHFEGGNAGGSDGCNRYAMGYAIKDDRLEWTSVGVSTQMACAPDVMRRAQAFMDAVRASTSYRLVNGRLELMDEKGKVRAVLDAQSRALAGTSWRALGINNGKGAVASIVLGSNVSMVFGPDGRVTGFAGCNHYSAGYEADPSHLKFTQAAATRKMCASEDVMRQEQAFLQALETVSTMRFEGNRLDLRRADGALAIALLQDEAK
jgi:heat shock protein HslJ